MTPELSVVGWLALLILALPIFFVTRQPDVWTILGVALVLRVGFVFYNTYISTLQTDDFEGYAAITSAYGWDSIWAVAGANSKAYYFFCSLVYFGFGRNPLLLQNINVALSLASILLLIYTARDIAGWRAARLTGWAVALAPFSIIYSSVILREATVIFPAVLGVRFWVLAMQQRRLIYHVITLLCFGISALFHYGCIALVFAWGLLPSVYHFLRQPTLLQKVVTAGLAGLASTIVLFVLYYFGVLDIFMADKIELSELSAGGLGEGLQVAARGRASYLHGLVIASPLDMAWQLPIRMVYLLFTPFPWMVESLVDAAGFIDALIYLALILLCFLFYKRILRQPILVAMLVCFTLAIGVFSVGTSNYGTAIRHRAKFYPMLCLIAICAATMREGPYFLHRTKIVPLRSRDLRTRSK